MANLKTTSAKQQGVVLITALIMVIAVTGIAVTLMSSSSIDVKITNAAQEREVAENKLIGEIQRVIFTEVKKGGKSSFLLSPEETITKVVKEGEADTFTSSKDIANHEGMKSTMTNLNKGVQNLTCLRSNAATTGISCNILQVTTTIEYGSKSKHQLTIVTGMAQQVVN
ncbi:pilus assembly protein PilX [Pseudoalteromonas sp. S558]|uniref:pilus assembly PilX family protein n=1 Tax=Pseudoalteromonas sp. S558 TaxID=2066515 RepID=UPI00110B147A|nr:pilus assembly protein PilX [Pseudoalteromonas sp. S558]TMO03053.1 pilus assembly protein PilX [Pseudoalteromonas sp. S558]